MFCDENGILKATPRKLRLFDHEVEYRDGDYLMFGKETRGLPEALLIEHPERCVRIPMREGARSLNLSNSVAVIVFEALRQTGFENLRLAGPFPQA